MRHLLKKGYMFKLNIDYKRDIDCFYAKNFKDKISVLYESVDISHVYGRQSIIAVNPILEIKGRGNHTEITLIDDKAMSFLKVFKQSKEKKITINDRKSSDVLRDLLENNESESSYLGMYGAFAYEFVCQFYPVKRHDGNSEINDFRLFLFSDYIVFDHIKESAFIESFDEVSALNISKLYDSYSTYSQNGFDIKDIDYSPSEEKFKDMISESRGLAAKGEFYEIVLSRKISGKFKGEAFDLYLNYKEKNPSPYLFFCQFIDEQILGASPEMMLRVEDNLAETRPISGTNRRGKDAFEDHQLMMELLNSNKEKAELDMLVDLGRNDLSRVCKPGLTISDYRFVEKYSQVMHTVAHLKGELEDGKTAYDALIATINAGTLTGAPKIAAMNYIAKFEKTSRDYYGGSVGYLTFSNSCDTGILIRFVHIKNGNFVYQTGATVLYDSDPEFELKETFRKAAAFLKSISSYDEEKVL
jgi:anthranilate/para-aminobenzoate synthase component I